MARATWTQTNFNAGEWSPLTYGRADIAKYKSALATCLNYIPTAQGGLTRRPGTRYVAATKSNGAARLVRFEFSTTQAYILEFGNQYIRFYVNGGQLLNTGVPYEVTTPYAVADIWSLQFTQSADTLYIVHPNYPPRKLQRVAATNWTLTQISFLDGPYLPLNTTGTTLALSGTSGSVTVTASAALFASTDVGRLIRFKGSTTWGWLTITAFSSATSVTATVGAAPDASTATTVWRLGVWSATTGYPACTTFHQDRLVFAGATQYPGRVDGSNTSDYENFAPTGTTGTVSDSNALSYTINSNTVNAVQWMQSDEFGLLCGTSGGEWVLAPSSTQTALTPTNINAKNTTSYGSANTPPAKMGKSLLFVQRTKRKLREMAYKFELNTFKAEDVSMIGEHLTKSGLLQLAVQLAPQPIMWAVRNDGGLVAMSYDADQDILGWHQHQIGGTNVVVESVACIPAPSIDRDDVWLLVRRTVNGSTVRYVELMTKFWEDGDSAATAVYVDSSAQYSGAATTSITGLTWLEGQTVKVLTDGATHPDVVVTGGAITLQRASSVVQVGLGYTSMGKTLRIEAGGADGPAQGKKKRIHRVIFRFFQSLGLVLTPNGYGTPTTEAAFRSVGDKMDMAVPLYTGDKVYAYEDTWGQEGQVVWQQTDPLPSNVLMVAAQLETQDGG